MYNSWSVRIVQYLSRTSYLDSNSPSWPFYGLQEIHSESPHRNLVRSIAEMIIVRQTPSNHIDPPAPLRRITLGNAGGARSEIPFGDVWPRPLQDVLPIASSTGTQILWYGSEIRQDGTLDSVQ